MFAADPQRYELMYGEKTKKENVALDGTELFEPQTREEFDEMVRHMQMEGWG